MVTRGDRERGHHVGMADQIFKLGRAHVRIDRHQRDAERIERKPVQEEIGPVFQQHAEPMAMAVPCVTIGGAESFDRRLRILIAEVPGRNAVGFRGLGGNADEGPRGVPVRGVLKCREHRVRTFGQMRRDRHDDPLT